MMWSLIARRLSLGSVLVFMALAWLVWQFLAWGVFHAVWVPDLSVCDALQGQGACWGVVVEKWYVLLWGRYPPDAYWRAQVATCLFTGGLL